MTERSGNFSVVYKNPSGSGALSMWCHEDSPILSTESPYVGPLSVEEVEWLKNGKGVFYNEDMDFTVTDQSKGTN